MPMPEHLFVSDTDGALYDTRLQNWSKQAPLRAPYSSTFSIIHNMAELKATLRAGGYAWPGGYPLYFLCQDGSALSFSTVRKEFKLVVDAMQDPDLRNDWRVVACDVNWEDGDLYDAHTSERIAPAYDIEEDVA